MRITRSKIVAGMILTAVAGGTAALSGTANASGTTTETVTQVNTMTSALCYRETHREVIYDTHSSTKGWVREPAPKVELTISTHCYAKGGTGPAAGTSETVTQVNTMTSALCYRETHREVVYYTHSSTKGWVREPAPKVELTISTHCYAK